MNDLINITGERKINARTYRINTQLQVFNSKNMIKILSKTNLSGQDLCTVDGD